MKLKYENILLLLLTSLCIIPFLQGCFVADHPQVSPEGKIIGGNEKLREILKAIKALRDEYALHKYDVSYAWYSASIEPTTLSVTHSGLLPKSDGVVEAEYVLVYTEPLLDSAEYAVVTGVLLRNTGENKVGCGNLIYYWNGKTWLEYDPPIGFNVTKILLKEE